MSVLEAARERRTIAVPRELLLVGGLTVLAAVVRFVALGTQSFWFDEALSVRLVRAPLGDMISAIPNDGAEPPLYFVLAWFWTRVFGYGEAGVRSLSAAAGTLTIPVAYLSARMLAGRRAGLAVASLAALSPPLIWYSQEARSYSLMVLLSALSLLFFLRARERSGTRDLALWALVSLLAVASHYFAAFLVAPEALWLLVAAADRRRVAIAVAALGLGGAALAPLALHQRAHGGIAWIGNIPIGSRLEGALRFFVVGPAGPPLSRAVLLAGAALLAVAVVLLLRRAAARTRSGAIVAAALAAIVVAGPLAGALVGSDFFLDRNVLEAWLPATIIVAAALLSPAARGIGLAVLAATCLGFLAIDARLPGNEALQRDDWRGVARALGPPRSDRVIEVAPGWQTLPLAIYARRLVPMPPLASVTEVDTVVYNGARAYDEPVRVAPPGPGFERVATLTAQRMTIVRYRATRPSPVIRSALVGVGNNRSLPFLQRPG